MKREHLIFETVVGSRAYGTAGPESDCDLKGVYVEPLSDLLAIHPLPTQVEEDRGNLVYYSLRRFLELALNANPNIIELLFMPTDCVLLSDPAFTPVLKNRSIFVTKRAYASHVRYAESQIRKARGRNKWINNPQPKEPPRLEEFCWFVPGAAGENNLPFRPRTVSEADLNLAECHVSALEHAPNLYRLYHYGREARGVFRNGQLVCESIPLEDEREHCVGLLIVNEPAFERAVRDHRNYWEWRESRNEQRWRSQESGILDYDAKNMMHMFRLMISAEQILKEGCPLVRFEGGELEYLKAILRGQYAYQELVEAADKRLRSLAILNERSPLPEDPDFERAEGLLKEVTETWENVRRA